MPVVHVAHLLRLANRVMLLSDDRNLPMPLPKTQISTISFGHSVGTGRTGVRPAPDVPRGCPPHSFLRQEGPANPSAADSPSAVVYGGADMPLTGPIAEGWTFFCPHYIR